MEVQAEKALFDLTLLNAETNEWAYETESVHLLNRGVPAELVTRLRDLWEKTKVIGGEVVAIGKIIVRKIIDFLMANPGIAVGLAVGGAVWLLLQSIPFIGPLIAPIVALLALLYGFSTQTGINDPLWPTAVKLVRKFFELLIDIFEAVRDYVTA